MSARKIKVTKDNVRLDESIEWPIFDEHDVLLVRPGSTLVKKNQIDILLSRNAYYQPDKDIAPPPTLDQHGNNPHYLLGQLLLALEHAFTSIIERYPDAQERIDQVCNGVSELCSMNPDAAIGLVHLYGEKALSQRHPIFCAIICERLARQLEYEEEQISALILANLLAKISTLSYYDKMEKQQQPLTEAQWRQWQQHPETSIAIIEKAGLKSEEAQPLMLEYHELLDGSGFPMGKSEDELSEASRLMCVADYYVSAVIKREPRAKREPKDALRDLFKNPKIATEDLKSLLIKELGVYPPGTFVKLANGEVAVVINRQEASTTPVVKSVMGETGNVYYSPFMRDCSLDPYHIVGVHPSRQTPEMDLFEIWK